jgi:hypothetical protein
VIRFPINKITWIQLFGLVFWVQAGYGQSTRLPINLFELLPLEAQWLIDGEGVLSFEYLGHYKFITKFDDTRVRQVDVKCSLDVIEIHEIQNSDSIYTLITTDAEGGLTIINDKKDQPHSRVAFFVNAKEVSLTYNSDTVYNYANSKWNFIESENGMAIFGEERIKLAIYEGEIIDKTSICRFFKRCVFLGAESPITIREWRLFGLRINNSDIWSIRKSRRKVYVRNSNSQLIINSPPQKVELYVCYLRAELKSDRMKLIGVEFQ